MPDVRPTSATSEEKSTTSIWILAGVGAIMAIMIGAAIMLHFRQAPPPAGVSAVRDLGNLAQRMKTDPNSLTEADRQYIHSLPPQQRAQFLSQLSGGSAAAAPN